MKISRTAGISSNAHHEMDKGLDMTMSSVSSFGFDLRERIRKGDANLRTGNIGI
jgi:hypothetical protein